MGNFIPSSLILNKDQEQKEQKEQKEQIIEDKQKQLQNIIEDYKYLFLKYSINEEKNDYKSELENYLQE